MKTKTKDELLNEIDSMLGVYSVISLNVLTKQELMRLHGAIWVITQERDALKKILEVDKEDD